MTRRFTRILAALALLVGLTIPMGMWGQAPVNTVLWAEDFSGYSANDVPSGTITNSHTGTTVYGGVTLTYACNDGGGTTKIYKIDGSPRAARGPHDPSGDVGTDIYQNLSSHRFGRRR